MTGVDLDALAKWQITLEQRVIKFAGQPSFTAIAQQVGAPDIHVEQGVTGDQCKWLVALLVVEQQQRNMLRRVPWRVHDLQAYLAKLQGVALGNLTKIELVSVGAPSNKLGAGATCERLGAGDEIGVNMRLDHMGYLQAVFSGHLYINIDITTRVDDRSHGRFAVAYQIRNLCQAFGKNRFENKHRYLRHSWGHQGLGNGWASVSGIRISAIRPPPSRGIKFSSPPNRSAMARTMEMPRPAPSVRWRPWSPRQKRRPIWDACSGLRPGPRSLIVRRQF